MIGLDDLEGFFQPKWFRILYLLYLHHTQEKKKQDYDMSNITVKTE